jgi:hypothetical protein
LWRKEFNRGSRGVRARTTPLQSRQDAALILHMGAERAQIGDLEQRLRQLLLLQETVKKVSSILDLEQLLERRQ